MATYEVKYRCYLPETLLSHNFPCIHYCYRKHGKLRWEKRDSCGIDAFAREFWKEKYYDKTVWKEESAMPVYTRLCVMKEILEKEYGGSLRLYIKAMIAYEIQRNRIEQEADDEVHELAILFVTNGWQKTELRVPRGES